MYKIVFLYECKPDDPWRVAIRAIYYIGDGYGEKAFTGNSFRNPDFGKNYP